MASTDTIILCVDGSDASVEAVATGAALLPKDADVVIVTVVEWNDESLVTGGGGHAGGVMSAEEFDEHEKTTVSEGQATAERAAAAIAIEAAEVRVVRGSPGQALCELATELSARAIVLGTRGRGGMKRAFLGSVSDYVVRNAPCPVVVTNVNT